MKNSEISHIEAKVSYKDDLDTFYNLKILVGTKYKTEYEIQQKNSVELNLERPNNIFYIKNIDEIRRYMALISEYNFVIKTYNIFTTEPDSIGNVYLSGFGGDGVSTSDISSFLINYIQTSNDHELLSSLIEKTSGYKNYYDTENDRYIFKNDIHVNVRKKRLDDEKVISLIFHPNSIKSIPDKDVMRMMRDSNKIPEGMIIDDQFIGLEPSAVITYSYQLLSN